MTKGKREQTEIHVPSGMEEGSSSAIPSSTSTNQKANEEESTNGESRNKESGKQQRRIGSLFGSRKGRRPHGADSEETLKLAENPATAAADGHPLRRRHRRDSSTALLPFITVPCCLLCLLSVTLVLLLFLVTGFHLGRYLRAANTSSGAISLPEKEEQEKLMVAGLLWGQRQTSIENAPHQQQLIASLDQQQQQKQNNDSTLSEELKEVDANNAPETMAQVAEGRMGVHTPLALELVKAAKHGNTERVRALLDQGLDVNETRNGYGNTALHLAATYGHLDTVKLLLERRADAGANNSKQHTPLYYAACEGKEQVVQLLLQFGADANAQGRDGNTALHCAAEEGWAEIERILLAQGANVNAKNVRGYMPLHWAAQYGKAEACQVLLANGAELDVKVTSNSVTALHLAAQEGHAHILRLLLDHGADISQRDRYGWTALHYAIRNGRLGCVRLLLEHWQGDMSPRDSASLFALIDRGDDGIRELMMRKVFA